MYSDNVRVRTRYVFQFWIVTIKLLTVIRTYSKLGIVAIKILSVIGVKFCFLLTRMYSYFLLDCTLLIISPFKLSKMYNSDFLCAGWTMDRNRWLHYMNVAFFSVIMLKEESQTFYRDYIAWQPSNFSIHNSRSLKWTKFCFTATVIIDRSNFSNLYSLNRC